MPEAPTAEGDGRGSAPAPEDPMDEILSIDTSKAFPAEIPLDPQAKALSAIPPALYLPAVALAAAAAGAAGMAGARAATQPVAGMEPETKELVAAAVGAAAAGVVGYAGIQAKQVRDRAAVVDLFNTLVRLDDPSELTPGAVKAIGDRYGINMQRDQLDGLQQVFGAYLENIIPVGETQLRGDEAPKIVAFKEALGLDDEAAAPVFIEVGRRLSRAGFEISSRQGQFEQRKAFQRLVYLSYCVFGDQKAAFLLPWRRVFNLNDSQLFVARRNNARAIFAAHLREKCGGVLPADRTALRELRDYQTAVKLMDDVAEEAVRAAARAHLEKQVEAAVGVVRSPAKSRDPARVVAELRSALDYGRKLQRLANEDDLVPGLGLPSLHGGEWEGDGKLRDVREAFRVFTEESVAREGAFTPALDQDLKELATMLCLGARDSSAVRSEVAAALYRKLLREEVTSRRIDQADAPAKVIEGLVTRSGVSADAAAELHKALYRQKLTQLVAKKKLSDQDEADLARARRVLCIPEAAADEIMRQTAGRVFEEVLSDAFLAGAKPVSEFESDRVAQTVQDLRLSPAVARAVFEEVAKGRLRAYAMQAGKDMARDKKAAAQALKKLVQFNALVVTPLFERTTGRAPEVSSGAPVTATVDEDESAAALDAARRAAGGAGAGGDPARQGQKEITLQGEIEEAVRAELYKTYLLHAMSGDVVAMPAGGVIRKKTNLQARQQEMARLQQLGDVLGMGPAEVERVQEDLAERAFRSQVEEVLRGAGSVTPERAAYLEEMRKQLRLPADKAERVVREVRTEVLGASAALEETGGQKWDVKRVLQAAKDGVDVTQALDEGPRRVLLRREIDRRLSDGKAKFDAKLLLQDLPRILGIDERKLTSMLRELVGSRKRMLLVQAVSQYRQKRGPDAVVSLNNLLSAYRAQPEAGGSAGAVQWGERDEVKELFTLYCGKVSDDARRTELAALFGLSAEERADLEAAAGRPAAAGVGGSQQDDEAFF